MIKLSITQEYEAEVERLRRIRTAQPMQVHIELDQDQINYLVNLCNLDAKQRLDPKIVGSALQACLIY
jgi:hypothetical protein